MTLLADGDSVMFCIVTMGRQVAKRVKIFLKFAEENISAEIKKISLVCSIMRSSSFLNNEAFTNSHDVLVILMCRKILLISCTLRFYFYNDMEPQYLISFWHLVARLDMDIYCNRNNPIFSTSTFLCNTVSMDFPDWFNISLVRVYIWLLIPVLIPIWLNKSTAWRTTWLCTEVFINILSSILHHVILWFMKQCYNCIIMHGSTVQNNQIILRKFVSQTSILLVAVRLFFQNFGKTIFWFSKKRVINEY